jgi:hypothetical protein
MGWEVYPEGMYRVLERLRDYGHQHIFVTESGAAYPDELMVGVVADDDRLDYHRRYLAQVGRAAADGVPVEGYLAWSLLDNFEWQFGYALRAHPGRLRIPAAHGEGQRPMVCPGGRDERAHDEQPLTPRISLQEQGGHRPTDGDDRLEVDPSIQDRPVLSSAPSSSSVATCPTRLPCRRAGNRAVLLRLGLPTGSIASSTVDERSVTVDGYRGIITLEESA